MTGPETPSNPDAQNIAEQLEKTAADFRQLAVQIGAVEPGSLKQISPRRAKLTFAVVLVLAALAGWLLWSHWHSLLVATAPLIWIFGHGYRYRRRAMQSERS